MSTSDSTLTETQPENLPSTSPWSPLRITAFRYMWLATLVSNTGTWMHDVGAGWLMTSLSPSPVMVALVQTAVTLPALLLALPAGALADIFDRRRYLIIVNVWMSLTAALLGFLTITNIMNEWILLGLTFSMGIGTAMMMPAWQAVTPELVPRHELRHAISLNAMGVNVSRAIGPALAGVIVATAGSGAVFLINAITFFCIIIILWRWRRTYTSSNLPTERFFSAIKTGIRFARNSQALHFALIRGIGFFVFASALWALLPLIAKHLLQGGPQTYGILLASIGVGAVFGALFLPRFRLKYSSDQLVTGASLLYAVSMFGVACLPNQFFAIMAMALCGVAWITVMSTVQTAAQMALPNWVRSRGLAVFMMFFMGSLAGGSILWGKIAEQSSISMSLIYAAIGTAVAAILSRRWPISSIDKIDLSPSMHWQMPDIREQVTHDRSPVMIVIHYHVQPGKESEFLNTIKQLGKSRRRDGAYAWDTLEDAVVEGHYIEYYMLESWLEHLRQHERVTNTDRQIQEQLRTLLVEGTIPKVTHFVGPNAN